MASCPCQHCGEPMKKADRLNGSHLRLLLGATFLIPGVLLCLSLIGAVVGVPMILAGGMIVPRYVKVWRCKPCGVSVPRG